MEEFKIRDEVFDEKPADNSLVTCTPVMAGRKLNMSVPESPFLSASNNSSNLNNTPIMSKVVIDERSKRQGV